MPSASTTNEDARRRQPVVGDGAEGNLMGQSRVWWIGGVVAGAVMVAFGVAVIALAINGQHTVTRS